MLKETRITILNNDYVTIWSYPEKKIVHHQFHKFIHGQAFRDALNVGVDTLKKYGAHKWLSDDRENSALSRVDLEWAHTDWFPRTQAAGWKYWALVQPENVIGQLNMRREVKIYTEKGVITQVFSDPDEAMVWLESQ
jgi:hypothetical protein